MEFYNPNVIYLSPAVGQIQVTFKSENYNIYAVDK